MQRIAFIAELNQTNSIIQEMLEQSYSVNITFFPPIDILSNPDSANHYEADLILFDLNTSTGMGIVKDHMRSLKKIFDSSPILVIHPYDHKSFVQHLIEAGVSGVIPVAPTKDQLTRSIDEILKGKPNTGLSGH